MAEEAGILERAMKAVADSYDGAKSWAGEVMSVGSRADEEAERRFPGDARDNSQKNAYRHALGTGRLAQLLGADSDNPVISSIGQGLAQGAGYIWEGMSLPRNLQSAENMEDMRHDLNNNYHGADQAAKVKGYGELADRLETMARGAEKGSAPLAFAPARKAMTYTK